MSRTFSIPYRFAVNSGVTANQASFVLPTPVWLTDLFVIFPSGTSNLLFYRFFIANSPDVPATGLPGGADVFTEQIQTPALSGDGIAYSVPIELFLEEESTYLKMHANNGTSANIVAAALAILYKP